MPFSFLPPSDRAARSLFGDADMAAQRAFFAGRPELAPTPLRSLPALARALGLQALYVKDETTRFGLNAFKSAGAVFAISTLHARGDIRDGATLVCASEGNHGRAVARAARAVGCHARVYMADSVAPARVAAIHSEGATVVLIPGTYDQAVGVMAREAVESGWTVISDTSWPGYDEIPNLIMLGYTRLMDEAESVWASDPVPDTVFVQAGVGGLLAAVASWAHWRFGPDRPSVVGVEPTAAACVQAAVRSGTTMPLDGPFDTVMGGLRCGQVSFSAFETLRTLVDAYVAIEDDWAFEAIRCLAEPMGGDPVIQAGASGAAALGGLLATLRDPSLRDVAAQLALDARSSVLVLVTEGVTDPAIFDRALSRR